MGLEAGHLEHARLPHGAPLYPLSTILLKTWYHGSKKGSLFGSESRA